MKPIGLAFLALLPASRVATAQADAVIAVRGATIHTAAGDPIKNGTILVRAGKIVAVGANVAVPAGAKVYEMADKDITPGLIDNHSHIGARPTDLNDSPVIIGPQHRFIDALDWNDPDFNDAVSGGVTTIVTGPGSGENVSGMAVVIKTFGTDYSHRMLLEKGGMTRARRRLGPGGRSRLRDPARAVLRPESGRARAPEV